MCPDRRLIYMVIADNRIPKQLLQHLAEQMVSTNWRQHSPKVDTVTCNKINNIAITN